MPDNPNPAPQPIPAAPEPPWLPPDSPDLPKAASDGPARARLTAVFKLYHALSDAEQPSDPFDHTWTVRLKSSEQSWGPRHVTVGEDWQPVPQGWDESFASQVGCVCIFNREGFFKDRNPTPEERAEAEARVVEVGVAQEAEGVAWRVEAFAVVRPTTSVPLFVLEGKLGSYFIRCRQGTAKASITLIPG